MIRPKIQRTARAIIVKKPAAKTQEQNTFSKKH